MSKIQFIRQTRKFFRGYARNYLYHLSTPKSVKTAPNIFRNSQKISGQSKYFKFAVLMKLGESCLQSLMILGGQQDLLMNVEGIMMNVWPPKGWAARLVDECPAPYEVGSRTCWWLIPESSHQQQCAAGCWWALGSWLDECPAPYGVGSRTRTETGCKWRWILYFIMCRSFIKIG